MRARTVRARAIAAEGWLEPEELPYLLDAQALAPVFGLGDPRRRGMLAEMGNESALPIKTLAERTTLPPATVRDVVSITAPLVLVRDTVRWRDGSSPDLALLRQGLIGRALTQLVHDGWAKPVPLARLASELQLSVTAAAELGVEAARLYGDDPDTFPWRVVGETLVLPTLRPTRLYEARLHTFPRPPIPWCAASWRCFSSSPREDRPRRSVLATCSRAWPRAPTLCPHPTRSGAHAACSARRPCSTTCPAQELSRGGSA